MMPVGPATRIFLAAGATDLRQSFEGLSDLVRHRFQEDPLSGHLFVFSNQRRTRIKLLYWDGSGLWVCAKRLEQGRFRWPTTSTGETGDAAHSGRGTHAAAERRRPDPDSPASVVAKAGLSAGEKKIKKCKKSIDTALGSGL